MQPHVALSKVVSIQHIRASLLCIVATIAFAATAAVASKSHSVLVR